MKKIICVLIVLAVLLSGMGMIPVSAQPLYDTNPRTGPAVFNKDGFIVNNGVLIKYTGDSEDVVIPGDIGITAIGDNVFRDFTTTITSVTIPEGVTSIGAFCFLSVHLSSVTLPSTLKTIGESAFAGCLFLSDIVIPQSVTAVGDGAFNSTSIAKAILVNDGKTLCYVPDLYKTYSIPNTVTRINGSAFEYCSQLTSVTIPDSVTEIGEYAFKECSSLTKITIPNSVTKIEDNAFFGCENLSSLTIPDDIPFVGSLGLNSTQVSTPLIVNSGKTLCYVPVSYSSYTIPSTITKISTGAFYKNQNLATIQIPDSVTEIGEDAFYSCRNLRSVTFGKNITTIGSGAFSCDSFTSLTIPNSVTKIGDSAFEWCSQLSSITLPDSVEIGKNLFTCTNISKPIILNGGTLLCYVPSDYTSYTIPNTVTTVNAGAFANQLQQIQSVVIPDSVTSIGDFAFFGCTNLKLITIPDSVTYIGESAFEGCIELSSVIIPSSVTTLGANAFRECQSLTSVEIQGPITNLYGTFEGCCSLENITIPSSVTDIDGYAFIRCKDVIFIVDDFSYAHEYADAFGFQTANIDAPKTPQGVSVSAKTTNSISLKWNAVPNVTGYNIYVNRKKVNSELITNTVYTATKLIPGCSYSAAITAVNDKGESLPSAAVYTCTNPPTPTSVSAVSASYNSIKISWNAVSGVSGYTVYRSTSSNGTFSFVSNTATNSYVNSGLTYGTTYYYKVYAYIMDEGTKVCSNYSAVVSAKPMLSTPSSVKAVSASYNSNTISWGAVSGAEGYTVYRAASSTGTYSYLSSTANLSYTNSSLTTGSTYYYKVYAYKMVNGVKVCSNYSAVVSARPVPSTPGSFSAARASATSIKLSWSAVSGATGYTIYRSTSSTGTFSYLTSTTSASYTNTGLSKNTTYYYKIYAYRMVNGVKVCSNYTVVKSAKTY